MMYLQFLLKFQQMIVFVLQYQIQLRLLFHKSKRRHFHKFLQFVKEGLFHYQQIEAIDPNAPDVPMIRAFVEKVQNQRPADQVGKWKMEAN